MRTVSDLMLNLIAYEVCGTELDFGALPLSEETLRALYKLSKAHDLAHLVGDALIKNGLIADGEIKEKFEKQAVLAVYRYQKINYELNRLREILSKAQTPFIPLKGSVIRQYYPEPWMRTSCDIDILVQESDLARAVALLTETEKYRQESKGSHDVGLFSESGVHLELHYSLIEENCVGDMEKVLKSVWQNASAVGGTCEYAMSDAMFYYYHIAHMAKHFVGTGGCGVRPFLDIWILNHRLDFDRKSRNRLLCEGGLLKFAQNAEALSEVWFGSEEHTDITLRMQAYLLRGGVYGTTENRVAVQQVRRGGKFRYALSRIWLPYEVLRFQYPSLEGKKFLLPFYEVRRWFRLLFCGGAKRSANELKLNSATTDAEQAVTKEMLSELGIDL